MDEILEEIYKDSRLGAPLYMKEGLRMHIGIKFIHCQLVSGEEIAYSQVGSDGKVHFELPGLEDTETFLNCIRLGMFRKIPDAHHVEAYIKTQTGLLKLYLPY